MQSMPLQGMPPLGFIDQPTFVPVSEQYDSMGMPYMLQPMAPVAAPWPMGFYPNVPPMPGEIFGNSFGQTDQQVMRDNMPHPQQIIHSPSVHPSPVFPSPLLPSSPALPTASAIGSSALIASTSQMSSASYFSEEEAEEGWEAADLRASLSPLRKSKRRVLDPRERKNNVCPEPDCGKAFMRPSDLTRHLKIHSGVKPFKCDFPGCTKTFLQERSALTVHERVHSGERPHPCEHPGCSKIFSDSSTLARHRRVHQGLRPHHCPMEGCKKSFTRLPALKQHLEIHERKSRQAQNAVQLPLEGLLDLSPPADLWASIPPASSEAPSLTASASPMLHGLQQAFPQPSAIALNDSGFSALLAASSLLPS